jgi:hypothetical protein
MKSAGKQASATGTLGLTVARETADESLENQFLRQIKKHRYTTTIWEITMR